MVSWKCLESLHRKRRRFTFLILTVTIIFWAGMSIKMAFIHQFQTEIKRTRTVLPDILLRKPRPVILLWTTFFGGMDWFTESKNVFTKHSRDCILTNNKSEIESADLLVFHLNDIAWYGSFINGFGVELPKYRNSKQIWVLYNLEPLPSIWFDSAPWEGLFNWTMSYNMDSEVPVPYGEFRTLSQEEKGLIKESSAGAGFRYFDVHSQHGAVAMISNCIDDARRFRIIETLRTFITIKVIGRCGEHSKMNSPSETQLVHSYKFYLAFENSNCEHYVTEKYWRSLERRQIPIVAWRNNMSGIVIPGSYINVFGFRDLQEAGKYIAEVDRNETLYNSYFDWMYSFKIAYQNGWCKLCDAIQRNVTHMFYNDMHGWIHDDTCEPLSALNAFRRIFDRFTYDMRVF